jgi:hypothetical protein
MGFFLALSRAVKSNSIINLAMHIFLENFQHTATPSSMKTYPLVIFKSLV